jgi:hypothetical protein
MTEAAMEKKLFIDPPTLLRWMPREERNDVLFLDLEADFLDEHTIRLDLNIVFRPIPIRRGRLQTRDYYVGSTGARVIFEAFLGKIRGYTRTTPLKINYENTYTHSRKASVKIAPNIESGEGFKGEIGEVTFDKNVERTFTTRFSGAERTLSDVNFEHGVEWEVKLPEGQLIRDYLIGNLYLYVESSWDDVTKEGRIEVRPSDLLFFDSDRRVIADRTKVLAMRYALWRKGIRLQRESLIINFREAIDENRQN